MKKQSLWLFIISFVLIASSLTAISLSKVEPIKEPTAPQKANALPAEIKIGGVFPITKRPEAGRDRRDAFLIAIDEINNQTGSDRILPEGVKLVPIVKDDDNSPEGGTAAAEALVAEGVHIVIGSSGSSVSAAMQDVLKQHKIPQISYASSSPTLSDRDKYPYFMRVVPSDANQGKALAELAAAFGWKKGAAISTDDTYGTGVIQVFKDAFESNGGSLITHQTFSPGASDVANQLQAIKDANPEFILANMIDTDGATVFKKAKDLGMTNNSDYAWLITDGTSTTATFAGSDEVKAAMQYFIGTNPTQPSGPLYEKFNKTWFTIKTCGGAPCEGPLNSQQSGTAFNSYAPFAYDAVFVAAHALAAAGTTDGETLLKELYKVEIDGATGHIKFNELGEVDGKYNIVQLVGDDYQTIGSWDSVNKLKLNSGTLTLPGNSEWKVENNKATCTANCRSTAATPGFGTVELFAALIILVGLVEVIHIKRKKRR